MKREGLEAKRAEIVPVRPALLRDRDAAAYLARSPSWIRAMRMTDTKAARTGLPLIGPTWITIGQSIFYRLSDLDGWIAAHETVRGQVGFSNRGNGKNVSTG